MSDGIEINTYYELYCQCKLERDLLKQELQATREQLEKATNLLRLQLHAISPSDIMSTEKLVKDFLSKNKQKDEVSDG